MTKGKINTKGFTLMEVLVSIAVVGILFTPMLTFFSHTTKTNVNAKKMQRVNTVAQSVMEEVRSYHSIADMASVYRDKSNAKYLASCKDDKYDFSEGNRDDSPIDETYTGGKKYYFVRKNLESDGKKYEAHIEVDTGAYDELNKQKVPIISPLNSAVVAAETDETLSAMYEFQSRYHEKKKEEVSLDHIASKLKKRIKVEVRDSVSAKKEGTTEADKVDVAEDMVRVTIYNQYEYDELFEGEDKTKGIIQSGYLYNEEIPYNKLKAIYLFYNYDVYNDSTDILQGIDIDVNYQKHSDWKCDYKLYALCQKVCSVDKLEKDDTYTGYTGDKMNAYSDKKSARAVITKTITINGTKRSNEVGMLPIFSNFNYALSYNDDTTKTDIDREDIGKVVEEQALQRLAKVTVTILDSDGKKCTEITSTRGE